MSGRPIDDSRYLSGEALYGDDFTPEQIEQWFEAEVEGYSSLGSADRSSYRYLYHGWNRRHFFRHLNPDARYEQVLAFGSAWGDELRPLLDRIGSITMVDPSDAFVCDEIGGVPANYIKPTSSGDLPLDSDSYDLITCFGVLHHIPNVSHVIGELARVLKPGRRLLLREPIVSMGDWKVPRLGLTRHERGIPRPLLLRMFDRTGLEVRQESLCGFNPSKRLLEPLVGEVYNNRVTTAIDAALSRLFAPNLRYHASTPVQKLRPTLAAYVLEKR